MTCTVARLLAVPCERCGRTPARTNHFYSGPIAELNHRLPQPMWGDGFYLLCESCCPKCSQKGDAYEREERQPRLPAGEPGPLNRVVRTEGQHYVAGAPGGAPAKNRGALKWLLPNSRPFNSTQETGCATPP